jgi:hypothetical protein
MKSQGLFVSGALAVFLGAALCFSAPETITKLSAPFSFPSTVGVAYRGSLPASGASFLYNTRITGKKVVELSWSLPGRANNGVISIFTVSGSKIKTFAITSQTGIVQWDISESKKVSKGVYFASMSFGSGKKNLKLVIN